MIKIVKALRKNRVFVLLFLALPLVGLLLGDRPNFTVLADREFPTVDVVMSSPGIQAEENLARVTEVAERVFNGTQGLLHLESMTTDDRVRVRMIFKKSVKMNQAMLFLQERIDRLKLELPRDVKKIEVNPVDYPQPADLIIQFSKEQTTNQIRSALGSMSEGIVRAVPDIHLQPFVRVEILPEALARENLPLSQVLQAIQATGIMASLGEKGGVAYQLGKQLPSVEALRGLVIGARGHRPISLQQVANIELAVSPQIREVSLWMDQDKLDDIKAKLEILDPELEASEEAKLQILSMLLLPIIGLGLLVLLQALLSRLIFGGWSMLMVLITFDLLLGLHYLFWLSRFQTHITLSDITAGLLSLMIGSVFFLVLFSRIRSYFLPKEQLPKTIESTDQGSLIALAELLPTFLCLSIALYFLNLGLLKTDINVPSRQILSSLFSFGLPTVFLLLAFVPTVLDNRLIKTALQVPRYRPSWIMSRMQVRAWTLASWAFAFLAPVAFFYMPIGAEATPSSSLSSLLSEARGYGSSLDYLLQEDAKDLPEQYISIYRNKKASYQLMEFSPIGLKHLPSLDVVGFQQALRSLVEGQNVGFLDGGTQDLGIQLSGHLVEPESLSDMALASKKPEGQSKILRLLTEKRTEELRSEIYRNRMITANKVGLNALVNHGNLKAPAPLGLIETQWSSFIHQQLKEFNLQHISIAVFLFFLFAAYLNSFIRAGTLVGILSFPYAIGSLVHMVGVFHADSLWLFGFLPWLCLVELLVFARIADVERTRGFDRDQVVEDCRVQLAPSVILAVLLMPLGIVFVGLLGLVGQFNEPGLWKEAIVVGVLGLFFTWITARFFFPLFYLEAEETVERLFIRIALVANRLRKL